MTKHFNNYDYENRICDSFIWCNYANPYRYLTYYEIKDICDRMPYSGMKEYFENMIELMAAEIRKGENDILDLPKSMRKQICQNGSWLLYDIGEILTRNFFVDFDESESTDANLEHLYESILAIALEGDL